MRLTVAITGWGMFFFVSRVVGAVILIIGIAWFIQRKRHPERFKDSWKHAAMPDRRCTGAIIAAE